jgi:hypothetical protein
MARTSTCWSQYRMCPGIRRTAATTAVPSPATLWTSGAGSHSRPATRRPTGDNVAGHPGQRWSSSARCRHRSGDAIGARRGTQLWFCLLAISRIRIGESILCLPAVGNHAPRYWPAPPRVMSLRADQAWGDGLSGKSQEVTVTSRPGYRALAPCRERCSVVQVPRDGTPVPSDRCYSPLGSAMEWTTASMPRLPPRRTAEPAARHRRRVRARTTPRGVGDAK